VPSLPCRVYGRQLPCLGIARGVRLSNNFIHFSVPTAPHHRDPRLPSPPTPHPPPVYLLTTPSQTKMGFGQPLALGRRACHLTLKFCALNPMDRLCVTTTETDRRWGYLKRCTPRTRYAIALPRLYTRLRRTHLASPAPPAAPAAGAPLTCHLLLPSSLAHATSTWRAHARARLPSHLAFKSVVPAHRTSAGSGSMTVLLPV